MTGSGPSLCGQRPGRLWRGPSPQQQRSQTCRLHPGHGSVGHVGERRRPGTKGEGTGRRRLQGPGPELLEARAPPPNTSTWTWGTRDKGSRAGNVTSQGSQRGSPGGGGGGGEDESWGHRCRGRPGGQPGGSTGGGRPNNPLRTATSATEGKGRMGLLGRRGGESPTWTLG